MAATFALGLIGAGQMGAALVRGLVRAGALLPQQVLVSDADRSRAASLEQELGVRAAPTNSETARESELVLVAVKPALAAAVVEEIAGVVGPDQTLISVAAGVPTSRLRALLPAGGPSLVRVMPNTPALVGEGMFAIAAPGVASERVEAVQRLLSALGRVVVVEEKLMDAVTALSGSGPAFVFVMIEALADGGVAAGLPRAVAQLLAAQTVAGAAKMVLETGQHPAALKDAVASPSGTTIAGLAELERRGFRSAVVSAVRSAAARAREMSEG